MRFSGWRAKAPSRASVSTKVLAVVADAVATLGVEPDPECWVVWGDDPAIRYVVLIPTASGLVQLTVRVSVPGEGPRASGRIVRWNRVQLGELAVEIQGGHRLITFQVESQALHGADSAADEISRFAHTMYAAADGRPMPSVSGTRRPRSTSAKPAHRPPAKPRSVAKGA
jgi:hypothetical protein